MFNNSMAVGLECFLIYPGCVDESSRDTVTFPATIESAGVIRPGFAVDQARLCTDFVTSQTELVQKLVSLREGLEETFLAVMSPCARRQNRKRALQSVVWDDPSYRAIMMPLYHPSEGGERSMDLYDLADTSSCVVDIDVTHMDQEQRLLRWNLLNAVAPVVLSYVHRNYLRVNLGRHKMWQYCARKERLPTGWQWQRDFASYQKNVASLAESFTQSETRVCARDVFGNGLFHWAQLLEVGQKHVLRYWILPTMPFTPLAQSLQLIDSWLEVAAAALIGIKVGTLFEALPYLPRYGEQALPADSSTRIYLWESC